jgi:hypothetical protein
MSLIRRNNPTLLTTLARNGALTPMIEAIPALAQTGAQIFESTQHTRRIGMQCHHEQALAREETRRFGLFTQDMANHRASLNEALRRATAPEERAALTQALIAAAPRLG